MKHPGENQVKGGLLVVVFLLVCRCVLLCVLPLTDPTEGRYAVIARDMVTTGDWVTPHLWMDGQRVPFLGKPPLYFWSSAVCMKLFGINEFTARLPGVLCLGVTLLLMWSVLRCYADETIAWRAVFILLSSVVIFVSSGVVIVDIMVMMSVAGALLAYYAFTMETDRRIRRRWSLLVFVMLGLGFMTKGPVALVLFGLPVLVWSACFKRWRDLAGQSWVGGMIVFSLITVPWFVLCELKNPGFLNYFFVNENFLRFVVHEYGDMYGSGHEHIRGTAIWMMLAAGCPWSIYGLVQLVRYRKSMSFKRIWADAEMSFFLIVVVMVTLFWCLARQLLITYLFPAVPLLAVWLAMVIARYPFIGNATDQWFKRSAMLIGGGTILVLAVAGPYVMNGQSTKSVIEKSLEKNPTGGVYFVRKVPYSAYFYGSEKIVPHSEEELTVSIEKGGIEKDTSFVAKLRYYNHLFDEKNWPIAFEKRYGKYVLFKIQPEMSSVPPVWLYNIRNQTEITPR